MNNKFKRSITAVLATTAICNPLCTFTFLSDFGAEPISAYAAPYHSSGYTTRNGEFTIKSADASYTLYFDVKDSKARTAVVCGCFTAKSGLTIQVPEKASWRGVDYTITEVGDWAFDENENISSVILPKTITKIGSDSFINCSNLTNVSLTPQTVGVMDYKLNEIGEEAFSGCEKLSVFSFDSVEVIGDRAFENCSSLTSLCLPKIRSLGKGAFYCCPALNEIDLSASTLTEIPESAFECFPTYKSDTDIKLPSTVKTIGKKAFYHMDGLRMINLSHVTYIGESAFEFCGRLKTVYTSDDLASIGDHAFYGCNDMTYFVCKNPDVHIGNDALGYDYVRNYYQGKKQDFTLWSSNGGGNVRAYAAADGRNFQYKNTEDAPAEAIANFKDYMWQTGTWTPNCPEFLAYNNKYLFIDGHKPYVEEKNLSAKFTGSCAGLATICALTYNGYLTTDQFAPGYSRISDITQECTPFTKSFINTVWSNFNENSWQKAYGNIVPKFGNADDDIIKYIEYITYGEDVAVMTHGVSPDDEDTHGIVCLGMEYINDEESGMDRRILLYDVNNYDFKTNYCIEFNSKTGEWRKGNYSQKDLYTSSKNPNFCVNLYTDPDKMVSNGSLSGMELINKLLSIKQ